MVAGAVASGWWPVASAGLCSRLAALRRCQAASAHGSRLEALHGAPVAVSGSVCGGRAPAPADPDWDQLSTF